MSNNVKDIHDYMYREISNKVTIDLLTHTGKQEFKIVNDAIIIFVCSILSKNGFHVNDDSMNKHNLLDGLIKDDKKVIEDILNEMLLELKNVYGDIDIEIYKGILDIYNIKYEEAVDTTEDIAAAITLTPTMRLRMVKLITGNGFDPAIPNTKLQQAFLSLNGNIQWQDIEVVEMYSSQFYSKDPQ
jgi:hypothetical protein